MGFNCGLVGLPNVGKSTIFNAITNLGVAASAYPFCTIDPHFGTVSLEDKRLDDIYRIIGSAKMTPTTLEFVDIAGLVKGAHEGEGLGSQFLSNISRVDAVIHIVRCFEDKNVSHPYDVFNPVKDAQIVTQEIILKDIDVVKTHLKKYHQSARSGDSKAKKKIEMMDEFIEDLSNGNEIRSPQLSQGQKQLSRELNLLTAKPVMFIANVDEEHLHDSPLVKAISDYAASLDSPCIPFCGKIQSEIAELDHTDQLEYLQAMGLTETGLQKLVKTGYSLLNLITFFTANENEAHAWTIKKGSTVIQAAEKVHSDFAEKFIKAEVINCTDLVKHGSPKKLHELGLATIHGRDYLVEDGDLILFRKGK